MNAPIPRARLERFARLVAEVKRREARKLQSQRSYYDEDGVLQGGLIAFVRHFWHVLEPDRDLVEGWPLWAMCQHLEAVTFGEIKRLLINVPPGFMKSLLVNVYYPAWEQGPMGMSSMRYLAFSYASSLTERDNGKFRNLLISREYRELYGDKFTVMTVGVTKIENNKTGWKLASSVGGVGTGERADRVLLDDPHPVKDAESDQVRSATVRWFIETMSNRLNDLDESAIIVIMQRVHESDVSGEIISNEMGYVHLMIPWDYDSARHCETAIGWSDPRIEDGEPAWPERFSKEAMDVFRVRAFMWSSQYAQSPEPRGGAIFKRDDWMIWETPDNKTPEFDFIVASLDTNYGEREENAFNALTIWGVWTANSGDPKVMLLYGWRGRLPLHGDPDPRKPGEKDTAYRDRTKKDWGLVETVEHYCTRFKIHRLLIEDKTRGKSVAEELRRLYKQRNWGVQLIPANSVDGDKVARAWSVQHLWTDGMVYKVMEYGSDVDYRYIDLVVSEMAVFPKGKSKDLCFVAGTMIATAKGNIPIEAIRVGDRVVTPFGLKAVVRSGLTGSRDVVTRLGLTGTTDHPIFTFDKGYVPLHTIVSVSDVGALSLCGLIRVTLQRQFDLTASYSASQASESTTSRADLSPVTESPRRGCMSQSGSLVPVSWYRMAMKSIIRISTLSIASMKIWSAYRCQCIGQWLRARLPLKQSASSWILSAIFPLLGIGHQRVVSGTDGMPTRPSVDPGISRRLLPSLAFGLVSGAEMRSSTAARNAFTALAHVSSKEARLSADALSGCIHTLPVFNLEVEGAHCYYANGILVHNCDTATQALRFLRDAGLLLRKDEAEHEREEKAKFRRKPGPLYPG